MEKGKKILIISLVIILLILITIAVFMILDNKKYEEIERQEEEAILNAEENFKNLFTNLEYTENENEAITLSYEFEQSEEGKYDVNVNSPLLNIETDTAKTVNDEIDEIFGRKLISIVKENTVYTKYTVDYIAYTNNNIISLIIKATLKEGNNPQRLIVKTYNYDLEENKILSLEDYIVKMNLDKGSIQAQITSYVREKSETVDTGLAEEYNLYVRDVRSEKYLIENVEDYYIGEDGKLYIVFAYGNNNFTETTDVIIVK